SQAHLRVLLPAGLRGGRSTGAGGAAPLGRRARRRGRAVGRGAGRPRAFAGRGASGGVLGGRRTALGGSRGLSFRAARAMPGALGAGLAEGPPPEGRPLGGAPSRGGRSGARSRYFWERSRDQPKSTSLQE